MTSRDCLLKFKEMPRQVGAVSDLVLQSHIPVFVSTPVFASSAETVSVAPHVPLSGAMMEVITEANRRSPSSEPTALVRPPPVLLPRIVPHPPVIPECSTPISPRSVNEAAGTKGTPVLCDPPLHLHRRYDSPEAISSRYVAARNAWYAAQPTSSIKTNQQYRKAKGLPQRYGKKSYEWCLDFKQMSKLCVTTTGLREWTKEEMMAYLISAAQRMNGLKLKCL